jgi:hypothetical protein
MGVHWTKKYIANKICAYRVDNIIMSLRHQFLALGVAIFKSYNSRRFYSSTR